MKRVQRDKDQFIQTVLEASARLMDTHQEDLAAIKEIDEEQDKAEPTTPSNAKNIE